jgi:hypothetical protein
MWRFAARTMPRVAGLCGVRATSPIVIGGFIAIGTVFAIAAQTLAPSAGGGATQATAQLVPGGETVIAKLADAGAPTEGKTQTGAHAMTGEPTSLSGLLTMALAPAPTMTPPAKEEPNLEGLSEIPKELIWNRPQKKEDTAKPKAFAAFSKAREQLPWDAVEPVPFSPLPETEPSPIQAKGVKQAAVPRQPLDLPDGGQVEGWIKAKVTEIKGAERSRPLYHFELWLEPPAEVKRRLVGVAYAFSTPAIRPQSQASSDQASGFRISAGGLACVDEIIVTLRFDDGRSEKVAVDGCKLLG